MAEAEAAEQVVSCALELTILVSKAGQPTTTPVTAKEGTTGQTLKDLVQEVTGVAPEQQLLFFQNGSRNSAKAVVNDEKELVAQGVEDGATITVRVNDQGTHALTKEESILRQSIAKNGKQSYYYAHANEKALPMEHRYAYGGEPAKLETTEAPALETQQALQAISKYSWADEGDFVCIYISADGEPEAIEAAGDGKSGQVAVEFGHKSVELRIAAASKTYALIIRQLENEISPEECKHRVSAGKRVTLKLRKKRTLAWTRLVKPS